MATKRSRDQIQQAVEDARLLKGLSRGDESALRLLISTYGKFVFARAQRVLHDDSLAEEVAQETFLAVWADPDSFDPSKGNLKTFLLAVAKHKAIDVRRHELKLHARETASLDPAELIEPFDRSRERDPRLARALEGLSQLQKQAILLAYFGGLTHKQIAEELGIPYGTVKTRIRDALSKLRLALVPEDTGITPSSDRRGGT